MFFRCKEEPLQELSCAYFCSIGEGKIFSNIFPRDGASPADSGLAGGYGVSCLTFHLPCLSRLWRSEKPSQRRQHHIEPVMMKPVTGARDLLQFGLLEMRQQAGGLGVGKKARRPTSTGSDR